ncbi:SecY-interacting protein [Pantoea sp.]|uniref:SecY-interacting protein n=1 Tax=Pantoea sp. TaxID=69393 RepID=UPI0028A20739|nr:SecY-interacting protein [Pantoea sp.]
MQQTAEALRDFTLRYLEHWQQTHGHLPASEDLFGIASPCVSETRGEAVLWRPQPFSLPASLDAVERALDIRLQPAITEFYTSQFAGDMRAQHGTRALSLLQVWSEADFIRMQENLIGHLVMKRRLKETPTLFIATTDSDSEIISICNLSGEVILEQLGVKKREVLSCEIKDFLEHLQPVSE